MRRSTTALILAALLLAAACGEDEPDETEIPRPAPTQRPVTDTTLGDTVATPAGQPGAAERDGAARPPDAGAGEPAGGAAAASGERLYTVQVAAFTDVDSARAWTGRLSSLDLPVWMSMAEVGGRTYYRVRVGAVPTVTEARQLGSMLTRRFEWPVWVAPVTPSDGMPEGTVESTRRALGGD
ncbi:MAG TPA: SPOR domain-containing protein [Longimicrobiales bacterium]|nr:SPOR domain-containing protein [Longimicrobiales bacterium]